MGWRLELCLQTNCIFSGNQELENQPETGKSDRAIGREVSEEVLKMFETFVSEDAIRKRAARRRGTFVPPSEQPPVTSPPDSETQKQSNDLMKSNEHSVNLRIPQF